MKKHKIRPQLPKGFKDYESNDIRNIEAMIRKIKDVYELYGFEPVETPMFEYTEALGRFLPDEDRPNQGVFSIQDDDEKWMSLRYDLTAPLARHFAQKRNEIQTPYRTYRVGNVFRNEKPGPDRFRQFTQVDADNVGGIGPAADAEMCMMLADIMENLGIEKGEYIVKVNSRKMLDAVMEIAKITNDEKGQKQKLAVLRAIDKLDKFGMDGVVQLLGEGRMDNSGDFTKGAKLSKEQIGIIADYLNGNNQSNMANNSELQNAQKELETIEYLVRSARYDESQIRIDPCIVRGLEYYTGPVYECELTFEVPNEKGEKVGFGAVAGGGRYDGLVERFISEAVPANGFSIGVSRLQTALKNLKREKGNELVAPVLVCVMDRDVESVAGYQKIVQTLRKNGVRAEMYLGNPKQFGKQLKYADYRGCPLAIIQGSEEKEKGVVQIKDLEQGQKMAAEIEDNAQWKEARVAQKECKVEDIVKEVKLLLEAKSENE